MNRYQYSNKSVVVGKGSQQGFTLLEVMMAMLVFVSVAMIQQEVTASTVSQYFNVKHKIVASWIAENKITELQLVKTLPKGKELKEDIKFANDEWQVVSKTSDTANKDIKKLDIDVYLLDPQTGELNKKFTLSSMLGRY